MLVILLLLVAVSFVPQKAASASSGSAAVKEQAESIYDSKGDLHAANHEPNAISTTLHSGNLAYVDAGQSSATRSGLVASEHPPSMHNPRASNTASPNPFMYDEQLGATFTQSFKSMAYNVTAVAQTDPANGAGPAYLLNGLSDKGYWYQVGLSYSWDPSWSAGFAFIYEVFNPSGNSIFPSSGGGGLQTFSGPVNAGDEVLLSLNYTGGNVVMYAYDWNTRANSSITYSAVSAGTFVGSAIPQIANSNGFFTGLMTEWYHASPYYSNVKKVTYSNTTFAKDSATMWIDEFYAVNGTLKFYGELPVYYVDPVQLHSFERDGATEYSSAYDFITGALRVSQPIKLTVAESGLPATVELSGCSVSPTSITANGTPQTVQADSGCIIIVRLPSTSNTRYVNSMGTSSLSISTCLMDTCPTYSRMVYHQFRVSVSYGVIGGGTPTAPTFHYKTLGASKSVVLAKTAKAIWADGAPYWSTNPLGGSTTTQRWFSSKAAGTVSSTMPIVVAYHHQFHVTVTASGAGTTSPASGWYNAGSTIPIKAIPAPSHHFRKWTSDTVQIKTASPSNATTTATINGAGTITATFV